MLGKLTIAAAIIAAIILQTTTVNRIPNSMPPSYIGLHSIGWPFIYRTACRNETGSPGYWAYDWSAMVFAIDAAITLSLFCTCPIVRSHTYCFLRFPDLD